MRTTFTTGNSRTQRLMVRGGLLVAGVFALGALAGLAERASANDASASGAMSTAGHRAAWDSVGAVQGALTVAELELDRVMPAWEFAQREAEATLVRDGVQCLKRISGPLGGGQTGS